MTIEHFIQIAVGVVSVVSILYIPKTKYRLALLSFLSLEATTWASINILVQIDAISFPVREFTKATQGGFIQNFIFYPMIFAWYMVSYPNKSAVIRKILHYIIFVSAVVWFIYFISVYTGLEDFIKGTKQSQLIRLYISFMLQFGLCHLYIKWFSKNTDRLIGV